MSVGLLVAVGGIDSGRTGSFSSHTPGMAGINLVVSSGIPGGLLRDDAFNFSLKLCLSFALLPPTSEYSENPNLGRLPKIDYFLSEFQYSSMI